MDGVCKKEHTSSSLPHEKYYIVSLRAENFSQLSKNDFSLIGFPAKSHMANNLSIGDKLVLYIASRKSLVAGIIEIDSEMIWRTELLWDDVFPKRYKTKPFLLLEEDHYVSMRAIKNELSFINPDTKNFGAFFMQGLRQIPKEDYFFLLDVCKKASISHE